MGNSLGCSATGERLVSAARDGDVVEARMLLELSPSLARFSTFGGLNSPLHFAAAKGHLEIVTLLLEKGADVNSRNYCGQTALMQACQHGHWEVVQAMVLHRCNVARVDYLSGRTALHFAAVGGHVRCIRLLVADFVPSVLYVSAREGGDNACSGGSCPDSSMGKKFGPNELARFLNKAADGGLTALHMAAINGHSDCIQLLIDLHADVSPATFHFGSSVNMIGAGSTPLHYAAYGGSLKCCQVLLARGASRMTLNCNGWLPVDVARMWGCSWLELLLAPNSRLTVPAFPLSSYLSLPLMSIINIARESGLQSQTTSSDDSDLCAVCLERACSVAAEGCAHELCVKCALYLCSSNRPSTSIGPPGSIPCPLCRNGIVSFIRLARKSPKELKANISLSFCNPFISQARSHHQETIPYVPECRKTCGTSISSELVCPVPCAPFHSMAIPSCTCDDYPYPTEEIHGEEMQSPRPSQGAQSTGDKLDDQRLERTTCTNMFWNRRSCLREHQCNEEINL